MRLHRWDGLFDGLPADTVGSTLSARTLVVAALESAI